MPAMPQWFYDEQRRAKAQARTMLKMEPEKISVDTWLGGYRHLFPETRAEPTILEHITMLRPFREAHGDERMCEINAITAQAWALDRPAQVKLLRLAWKKAVVMHVAPFNIWAIVEKAPREKPKVRPPTGDELMQILIGTEARVAVDPWAIPMPLTDLVLVAAYTGARQSGLLRLRRGDVDMQGRRMTLTEKGEKTRTVLLLGPAVDAMGRQLDRRPATGGTSNPLLWPQSAASLQRQWRDVRGDFPHGFHSLRHFCATWLREQGVDPLDVAVQLGHTDGEGRPYKRYVEQTYDHPDPELALARIAERVITGV